MPKCEFPQKLRGYKIVFRFVAPPIRDLKRPLLAGLAPPAVVIEDRQALQLGQELAEPFEMVTWSHSESSFHPFQFTVHRRFRIVVLHIERIDPLIPNLRHRMPQPVGKSSQDIDIRSALHIQHITPLAGFDIMGSSEMFEAVANVRFLGEVIRPPVEKKRQVLIQRLVQDHFGMGDDHHLRLVACRDIPQQDINLLLP